MLSSILCSWGPPWGREEMHRLTARLLLIGMLVGILAPVSMAFSEESPHACCLRKQPHHHRSGELSFDSRHNGQDCCRPLAVKQWGQTRPPVAPGTAALPTDVISQASSPDHRFEIVASQSVRAPPASSLAYCASRFVSPWSSRAKLGICSSGPREKARLSGSAARLNGMR